MLLPNKEIQGINRENVANQGRLMEENRTKLQKESFSYIPKAIMGVQKVAEGEGN